MLLRAKAEVLTQVLPTLHGASGTCPTALLRLALLPRATPALASGTLPGLSPRIPAWDGFPPDFPMANAHLSQLCSTLSRSLS